MLPLPVHSTTQKTSVQQHSRFEQTEMYPVSEDVTATSIRFEIWGVVNPVQEIFHSNRTKFLIFRKNFSFSRQKFLTTFIFFVLNLKNFSFSHKKRRSLANFFIKTTSQILFSPQLKKFLFFS